MPKGNPILSFKNFSSKKPNKPFALSIQSIMAKAFLLLLFIIVVAVLCMHFLPLLHIPTKQVFMFSGVLAFIAAVFARFYKKQAKYLSFTYAFFKGIFIGAISINYANRYEGIIVQAIALTLLVFLCMFLLYYFKVIKVTKTLRSIVISVTSAIVTLYLISFILYFFNLPPIPYIHENGWIGILFSLIVSLTASFHLLLDFDFIEKISKRSSAKYLEWYAAFGLIISIVWQYLSILRLLKKSR